MIVFISADIEGISGVATHSECNSDNFKSKMSEEVAVVCEGALSAGATEILVRDAHNDAFNIDHKLLPKKTTLIRGFNGHPHDMMFGIDKCDVALCVGYHIHAGGSGNPLAHTLDDGPIIAITINGIPANELLISAYTASLTEVPIILVSGDAAICKYINNLNPEIETFAAVDSLGSAVYSYHPDDIKEKLLQTTKNAFKKDFQKCFIKLPEDFHIKIHFNKNSVAYRYSFYPGMKMIDETTLEYKAVNYFEVLRMIQFVIPY